MDMGALVTFSGILLVFGLVGILALLAVMRSKPCPRE